MARPESAGSKWAEVRFINGYALFMGFLSMAVRGLGFLVITWTTVVLLGGFVSMLGRKDFWCLTVITLIQTAGIFNVHMNEKLMNIWKSCLGFCDTMEMMYTKKDDNVIVLRKREKFGGQDPEQCLAEQGGQEAPNQESFIRRLPVTCWQFCRRMVIFVIACVQALVFATILSPLAALYACGLLLSGGLSLWRLIEHDFGNTDEDPSKANMNPALDVLYGLALVQGALFSYMIIWLLADGMVAKTVVKEYGFQGDAVTSVSEYLVTTRKILAKDPSLSTGRNLVTYAVKLLESESRDDNHSGTLILDTIITYAAKNSLKDDALTADDSPRGCGIRIPKYRPISRRWQESSSTTTATPRKLHKGEDMVLLIDRLLGSPSSSNIFHKLLKALGSISGDTEIRKSSARIVAHLAGNIRLNQFPRGIECISSLFDSSGQHDVDGYKELFDGNGYKELVLQGLRILGKLAADQDNCRVMCSTRGLVSKIMRPVSSNVLHRVDHHTWSGIVDASLEVMCCLLTTAPEETATKLRNEISSNKATIKSMRDIILDCKYCGDERHILAMKILTELPIENRENIVGRLVGIFVDVTKASRIRVLAGEKLVTISFQNQISIALLQGDYYALDIIATLLLEDESNKCRISAAGILEGLCSYYKDDDCFENLKNVITILMPKVLRKILRRESTQVQRGFYNGRLSSDIEDQNSGASQGDGHNDGHHEEQVALLSLCVMVYEKLISIDQYSALLFRLEEMVLRNSKPKVAGCLETLKLIGRMAIAMMRHRGRYHVEDLESLIGALERASKKMLDLDGFVLFSGRDDDADTLTDLVRKARELVNR